MGVDIGLSDKNWKHLLEDIGDGKCTPFLGAGASYGHAPLGGKLAEEWAEEYGYPLPGPPQLPQVAQYVSFTERPLAPKILLTKLFGNLPPPDFGQKDDPHGVLASLYLPCYVTTNSDGFMYRALEWAGRAPDSAFCHWWDGSAPEHEYPATFEQPLVYHLHGRHDVEKSMVVTELDYLAFLVRLLDQGMDLLPTPVQDGLAERTLLFVGYSLADWTTRVLLKSISGSLTGSNQCGAMAINLEPLGEDDDPELRARAREFLSGYLGELQNLDFHIFWGTAKQFVDELVPRLEDHFSVRWENGQQFAADLRARLAERRGVPIGEADGGG